MIAIISDIHGNQEALDAVLDSARQKGASRVICLGDIVGYGPDSISCLTRATRWDVVLAGTAELAMTGSGETIFPPTLQSHFDHVRDQIAAVTGGSLMMEFLSQLPLSHLEFGCTFAHATPNYPGQYIFPEHIYEPAFLDQIADAFEHTMFCGSSHIPGVFRCQQEAWTYTQPRSGDTFEVASAGRLICTVGSVGQPRDGDQRACYVLFDGRRFTFHRIGYDVETTMRKIKDDPDIHDMHGNRLLRGC